MYILNLFFFLFYVKIIIHGERYCIYVLISLFILSWKTNLISYWFSAPLHGFAFWFDVEFNAPATSSIDNHVSALLSGSSDNHQMDGSQRKKRTNPNEALVLSTAPEDPPTHWQQVWYIMHHYILFGLLSMVDFLKLRVVVDFFDIFTQVRVTCIWLVFIETLNRQMIRNLNEWLKKFVPNEKIGKS